MKPKLLLLLFLLMYLGSYADSRELSCGLDTINHRQKKIISKQLTLKQLQILNKRHKIWFDDCVFTSQYTIEQRLKKYPFSKAHKILAVSYWGGAEPNPVISLDTIKPTQTLSYKELQQQKGLVIIKDSLDYSTLIEVKTLDKNQIIRLTNIIFNTDFKKTDGANLMEHGACFEPRNSFIFLNKKGKVIHHLDICFHCHNYESDAYKLDIGTVCTQKYDMLRMFFISVGVIYGTNKDVSGY
ncbi:hypothetical protein SAMN05421821_103116 [Mucilaginibacter lappiensis]|uniref:Uncharacterized protein n=1 Tax=Mucilaginibacter lappiensis TaxID=354630 RepID=A0ABR6PGL2_9SPHI|nr:hypothetical protein [Mucilaginibacter lappiensis]MBB6108882.1 hypothetical protein [Mucilaginibacter lappiensis]SIQ66316.1 hypothetical protein SAMN05421821_103116 [Mucilaginibacter lappiensis]